MTGILSSANTIHLMTSPLSTLRSQLADQDSESKKKKLIRLSCITLDKDVSHVLGRVQSRNIVVLGL